MLTPLAQSLIRHGQDESIGEVEEQSKDGEDNGTNRPFESGGRATGLKKRDRLG